MIKARFIAALLVSMLVTLGIHAVEVSADEVTAPINVMLILTDDQRWDELGIVQREQGDRARFPFLETPRLDALASQGIRFRNAFVTTSLCSPSRAAILTGQYNHTNTIINNSTPFSSRPTWATTLRSAGYSTAYIGKWHHGQQWARPGFDHTATFSGHGKYHDTVFRINGEITQTTGYVDERSVDFAIQFLERKPDKPFAMMIGLKAVHQPFMPMDEHIQSYMKKHIKPAPGNDSIPTWSHLRYPILPPTSAIKTGWRMKILRTVNGIDKSVGRLLDSLEDLGLAENTLVIFTSDNGYHLGEHRLGDKRTAYEESIRVPLLVRLPDRISAGAVSDEMVLNIDLAPTILELAGLNIPAAIQGQSLRPLLDGGSTAWRESFLYENWREYFNNGTGRARPVPNILAIRTATHKLITYPGHEEWTELFDLASDPYETENLTFYRSAKGMKNSLCAELNRLLLETKYSPIPTQDRWLSGLTSAGIVDGITKLNAARPPLPRSHCGT